MHPSLSQSITIALLATSTAAAIEIPMVQVGAPGNPNNRTLTNDFGDVKFYGTLYGAVDYTYYIGQYEITNTQYTAFLNAVAATDTHGLYNTEMSSNMHGGIERAGSAGSYTYTVKAGNEAKPVVFVSFYDSARFANWLTNGQGSGTQDATTTESGVYHLNGVTAPAQFPRNSTEWNAGGLAIPTDDEWHKAAYYDPIIVDPTKYWSYPIRSHSAPSAVAPNTTDSNSANYNNAVGTLTDVGAYQAALSWYGTYDQAGNALEWHQPVPDFFNTYNPPRLFGGSYTQTDYYLLSNGTVSKQAPSKRSIN